jgi:hypothetical protein
MSQLTIECKLSDCVLNMLLRGALLARAAQLLPCGIDEASLCPYPALTNMKYFSFIHPSKPDA